MGRLLAVSSGERSLQSIQSLLKEAGFDSVPAQSAAQARRRVLDEEYDAVVINYPLADEAGLELGRMIMRETSAMVIYLIKNELLLDLGGSFEKEGMLTVEKPILKPVLFQTVHLAVSLKQRLRLSEEKIRKLEKRIEELKTVDKAKCALALKRGMSEEEAHKYVERTAMDLRITLRDAAMYILRTIS